MQDVFGRELSVGDLITYAVTDGYLRKGFIYKVTPKLVKTSLISQDKDGNFYQGKYDGKGRSQYSGNTVLIPETSSVFNENLKTLKKVIFEGLVEEKVIKPNIKLKRILSLV